MRKPRFKHEDDGETVITHVPSVRVEGGEAMRAWRAGVPASAAGPAPVRTPFRALAAVLAAIFLLFPVFLTDESLYVRAVFFLGGVVFGGLALLPGGRLDQLVARRKHRLVLPPSLHDERTETESTTKDWTIDG